jgi:hypothetical protein
MTAASATKLGAVGFVSGGLHHVVEMTRPQRSNRAASLSAASGWLLHPRFGAAA